MPYGLHAMDARITSEGSLQVFSNSQVAALLDAIRQPALVVDADLIVVAANSTARRMLEIDLAGQHLSFALRAPAILKAAIAAAERGEASTAEHHAKSPIPRSLSVQCSRLGLNEAKISLALVVLEDLTYQEQVERMRADFVANASHELRTPLTSLMGFIETMQGPARHDEAGRDRFLALMKTQASRMARLIDDLLSLSRIEVNEHRQPRDIIDLALLARQAAGLLEPVAKEAGCAVSLDLPRPLKLRGEAGELTQVIYNLIENAIKYAASGKVIEVSGTEAGGEAVLSVRDRGPGIAAHHLPRLTERFYRVSSQDSRSRGGTGLGLAIVKHILNRHRGRLVIESEPGRGSAFSIRLPLEQ